MSNNKAQIRATSIAKSIKTATVALAIAVGVTTASTAWGASVEQYVYSRDGVTIVTAPRALPSVGVRISDNQLILGLHGASDTIKASCGWYRVVPADEGMIAVAKATAAENHNGDVTDMVVDKVSYELTGEGTAVTVRALYRTRPMTSSSLTTGCSPIGWRMTSLKGSTPTGCRSLHVERNYHNPQLHRQ